MSDGSEFQVSVELRLRMPAVQIQFVFLQQTASGRRKIAEAEQEQWTGSGRSGILASTTKEPGRASGIQPVKHVPQIPKVFLQNKYRKTTEGERAEQGSPGNC